MISRLEREYYRISLWFVAVVSWYYTLFISIMPFENPLWFLFFIPALLLGLWFLYGLNFLNQISSLMTGRKLHHGFVMSEPVGFVGQIVTEAKKKIATTITNITNVVSNVRKSNNNPISKFGKNMIKLCRKLTSQIISGVCHKVDRTCF